MMLTKLTTRSWSQLARLSQYFSWAGKASKPQNFGESYNKKETRVPETSDELELGPKKVNYKSASHVSMIKRKSKATNPWTDKLSNVGDFDDEVSDFVVSLDADELKSYAKYYKLSQKDVNYLRIIIEGVGASKFNTDHIKEILSLLESLPDLDALSTPHVYRIAKWTGTSFARKLANIFSRKIFMKFYFELVKRKSMPLLLGNVDSLHQLDETNPEFDPVESDISCEDLCKEHPKLLKLLPKKISELFYEEIQGKKTLEPTKFYQFMDMIVCMSNLNLYRFESFQTAKLLLWYAMTYMPNDYQIHWCITAKATNFYWAFTRVRVPDTGFSSKLLLFYTHKYLHKDHKRQFNLLHCLTLEMVLMQAYFKVNQEAIQPVIQGITLLLSELRNEPNNRTIYNAKNSIMYCQVMLNLFPELGPLFRGTRELIDFEPLPDNPFREYFYDMTDNLVTYLWISHSALESKKMKGNPSLTIYNNGNNNFHIARESNYRQLLLYQNKVVAELKKVPAVKTLSIGSNLGMYEADIIINEDYVLEVDSQVHYVYCSRPLPIIGQFLKQHHLKAMGFKNVHSIGSHDKNRVYSEHSNFFKDLVTKLLSGQRR